MRKCVLAIAVVAFLTVAATPSFAQVNWSDSFQSGSTTGWDNYAYGADTLAPGYGGITSQEAGLAATGSTIDGVVVNAQPGNSYFGVSSPDGNVSTTDFGNASPGVFGLGYTTSISVYMDSAMASATGLAFAWIQGPVQLYQNEFSITPVVVAGVESEPAGSGGYFQINPGGVGGPAGSTTIPEINAGFVNIATAGWYTFTDRYSAVGGDLNVYMSVLSGATTLASWDIVTTTPIASVTGNVNTEWGQMVPEQMPTLAFDDSSLIYATPEPISMIFFGTGLVAVGGYISRRRMARKA